MLQARTLRTFGLPALVVGVLCTAPLAAPSSTSVGFAPYGNSNGYSGGESLALSPLAAIVPFRGTGDSDDGLLLLTGLDDPATATKTPLAAPVRNSGSGPMARLTATRIATRGAGQDGASNTGDETILVCDQLGSGNTVTPVVIGYDRNEPESTPTRLSASSLVLANAGTDRTLTTDDDELLLVTGLGSTPTVTRIAAPYLANNRRSQPIALSPTSCLLASTGPDAERGTDDDVTYLFSGLGTTNTRTPLATPWLSRYPPAGRARRLTSSRAVVIAQPGEPDSALPQGGLYLLDDLGGTNSVTPIPVRNILRGGGGRVGVLSATTVAVCGSGADLGTETEDDEVHVITNLGTTNDVTTLVVGGLDSDEASAPTRLSPTRFVLASGGDDLDMESGDDQVAVLSGVGSTNTLTTVSIPGLAEAASSRIAPLSSSGFIVADGGADFRFGSGMDDGMTVVTGLPAQPLAERTPVSGHYQSKEAAAAAPLLLGRGRAFATSSGPDGRANTGDDDVVNVFTDIPMGRALLTKKVLLKFRADKPAKPTKLLAKGKLVLDGLPFGEDDVTVSIGNFGQTIPADAFTASKKGVVKYRDKRAENGPITKVVYNPRSQTLTVTAKGVGIGAETTSAGYVVFALESADWFLADAGAGKQKKSAILWKP